MLTNNDTTVAAAERALYTYRPGEIEVEQIQGLMPNSGPDNLAAFDGQLFFAAESLAAGRILYRLNPATTEIAAVEYGSMPSETNPAELTILGNTLFFVAGDANLGEMLFDLVVGQRVELLVAGVRIPVARFFPRYVSGCVAIDTGARLLDHLHAFGEHLVLEHVGVAAFFSVIDRECIAGPHAFELGNVF